MMSSALSLSSSFASGARAEPDLDALDGRATSHLIFRWQEALYAVESLGVREVLPLPPLTPLHEMSPLFLGVTHLRDQFLPVADLGRCLGLALASSPVSPHISTDPESPRTASFSALSGDAEVLVVLQWQGVVVGIVVSEVCDVTLIAHDAIHLVTSAKLNSAVNQSVNQFAGCIAGVARVDGQNLQLLHLPGIFDLLSPQASLAVAGQGALVAGEPDELIKEAPLMAVVRLRDELFGIAVNWVCEFAPLRTVTPVPRCPQSVVGLMNLRGEVLTLLDIRASLHLSSAPVAESEEGVAAASQIVVVECDEWRVGVLVDEVLDVFGLPPGDIAPVSGAERNDTLSGTAWFEGKMLGILDVPSLLQQERSKMGEL